MSQRPAPWHLPQWQQVLAQAGQGRLAHALLLAGPRGIGKQAFAAALAAWLLCEQRGEQACGQCRSCQQHAAGTHPNHHLLTPGVDDKTGKPRRDIGVEQVRDLGERLGLTAHYGQAKVIVIHPADALSTASINALLKRLEEPQADTYFLLVSERPQSLPATLRSRCQRLRLTAPSAAQAADWLSEQGVRDDAVLLDAVGAPMLALELAGNDGIQRRKVWARELGEVAARKRDPLAVSAQIPREFAVEFMGWAAAWLTAQLREALHGGPAIAPARAIEQLMVEVLDSRRQLAGNGNPQLLIESFLILCWRLGTPSR